MKEKSPICDYPETRFHYVWTWQCMVKMFSTKSEINHHTIKQTGIEQHCAYHAQLFFVIYSHKIEYKERLKKTIVSVNAEQDADQFPW